MTHKPWFANGLRFSCTRCGNCCRNHGEYTYVYLTGADVSAIARHLCMPESQFLTTYCQVEDGWVSLRMDSPACPFLQEGNACGIYPVRPKQCATWPFWKENLRRSTWEGEVKADCPGIGQGDLHSSAEIERVVRENEEWYGD